jgi:RNase P/RNase MRP subunit p29
MKNVIKALVVVLLLVPAAAIMAQSSTVEVKSGEVISVYGDQLVVKMSTGEVKSITVPAGFMFKVDGVDTPLADLKPGTMLTAAVTTTTTPEVVRTVKIKNGEVIKVVGSNLWVRTEGQIKSLEIPAGFTFTQDGKQVTVDKLRVGTLLTAEIVYKSEKMLTEKDVQIGGAAPVAPAPAPEPVAAPAPEPEPEAAPAEMPKTASNLALVGLLGLALVAAGAAARRF